MSVQYHKYSTLVPRVVQVVSIDAMNTLIGLKNSPAAIYAEFANRHGIHCDVKLIEKEFPIAFSKFSKRHPCYGYRDIGSQQWWTLVIRSCVEKAAGKPIEDGLSQKLGTELFQQYDDSYMWKLVDPTVKLSLLHMKKRGIRLAVVSNFDSRLRNILKDFGLFNLFDVHVLSSEVGFEKPDPRIFEIIYRMFDLKCPREILHIGDHVVKDYSCAKAFGSRAMLFCTNANADNDVPAVDHLYSFSDLNVY